MTRPYSPPTRPTPWSSLLSGLLGIFLLGQPSVLHAQNPAPAAASSVPGAPASATTVSSSYVLSPNDRVQISVFQEDDLNTTALVSKDGTINFPLLNSVKIGGLTQAQARDLITDKLRADFLVNPQVSFTVTGFASKRFTVLGQVNRPGPFELPAQESIDLLEAIAMAGGYTRIGDASKITIRRKTGDKEEVLKLNASKMAKNANSERVTIKPGDSITVGESIF